MGQEVDSPNLKLKLLEADLDTAEDKAADHGDKCMELEAQNEELIRENKHLELKGTIITTCTSRVISHMTILQNFKPG